MLLLKKLTHMFPTTLPIGAEQYKAFVTDIVTTYGYPDKPGYKELIGNLIQHSAQDKTKISKRWFANAIKKAQINETAYWAIVEAKKEGAEQAELAKQQEVTKTELTSVEPTSQI